jgi:hypothetical protein
MTIEWFLISRLSKGYSIPFMNQGKNIYPTQTKIFSKLTTSLMK